MAFPINRNAKIYGYEDSDSWNSRTTKSVWWI